MPSKEVKKVYETISDSWVNFRKKPQQKAVDFLNENPKTGFFLDIGCGSGRHTKLFSKNYLSVGIDISKKMLLSAKKADSKSFYIQADFSHLPFKNSVFDKVLCYAVLHHLDKNEQETALYELRRTSRKNSSVLITVWKRWQKKFFPKALFSKEVHVPWGSESRYYYLFSKADFLKTLKKAGFGLKSLEQDKMNFFAILIFG